MDLKDLQLWHDAHGHLVTTKQPLQLLWSESTFVVTNYTLPQDHHRTAHTLKCTWF